MYIKEFKTTLTSFEVFSVFKDDPYCFILDSGMDPDKLGRFSFIGSRPFLVFKSKNHTIEISKNDATISKTGNPFFELQRLLDEYQVESVSSIPFIGGAVGYFSYDLCHHIERLARSAVDDVEVPDCFFGFYDGIIAIDHKENKYYSISLGLKGDKQLIAEELIKRIIEAKCTLETPIPYRAGHKTDFEASYTKEQYLEAVESVREYIRSGDIYQANLTQRFKCSTERPAFELYNILRTINPAPFAAYMNIGDAFILSSSPERFIKIKDKLIETRPIKGTRPRGKNPEEDMINRKELLESEKDKSELLMIVDLERNDLGRVSVPGTVKVTELFCLEEYATVYHLVATITGKIRDEYSEMDAIMAAFPGGSITGAPKIRAMEIIDELEPTQRNIYTGSIGYIGFDKTVDLNIAIRTIVLKDKTAYFQAGGGIVWDSNPEEEYKESLQKAKAMMKALSY